ncbi:hypothetical protein [Arthrobacter sp. NicSoilB11]|uniref:hypothetical protein n=1 Tax=Arthrobacter sp. NicSoilB11 TaxID=2830999 RepID=UPI001CC40A54|nr:hypothetical protein [Arthrobacter sp. NicSoilB11]
MIAFASVVVVLPALVVMVAFIRSYRNARMTAGKKTWREITADVKGWTADTLPASLLVQVKSSEGAARECLIRYRAQDLPGFVTCGREPNPPVGRGRRQRPRDHHGSGQPGGQ